MGLSDETIVLDGVTLPWMGQVLAKHKMSAKGLLLFDTEYRHFKADWDLTLQNIGLPSSHAVPHQLRHSGPSVDMLKRCRTLMEIKARGKWQTDSSVKRYEGHARLNQEFQRLPKKVQNLALAAPKQLETLVQRFLCRQKR